MSTISAADVKKLRDQTGAGMMDCKAALQEARGDFGAATTIIHKKGLATAAKKAGRTTSEGAIGAWLSADRSSGVLVEVNCESDFVARTDEFKQLVADVLAEIVRAGDAASDQWLLNPGGPVQQRVAAAIGKLGENMAVPRFVRYTGRGYVGQYLHLGKIGVQVEFSGVSPSMAANDDFTTVVKEMAMQVAASSPRYVTRAEIPADVLDKEKASYRQEMERAGKPAGVIDRIVEGKLGSFYSQVVLPEQPSIRDPKMTVADVIAAAAGSLGAPITVARFARLRVGETV